jgi:hypothetical protein
MRGFTRRLIAVAAVAAVGVTVAPVAAQASTLLNSTRSIARAAGS